MDAETASELTQEVFLKVFRAREGFEAGTRFSSWIWTVARNTWTDWVRGQRYQPADFEEGFHETVECHRPNPEEALERASLRLEVRRLSRGLTRLQKRVLWLKMVRGLAYPEIARRLGLTVASVKSLVYRSRLALAEA